MFHVEHQITFPERKALCSTWNITQKAAKKAALCVLSGECVFSEAMLLLYITAGTDALHTGSVQNIYPAKSSGFLKAFAFGTETE